MQSKPLVKLHTVKAKPGERVLNVGAGFNSDNQWFAENGYFVDAVDPAYTLESKEDTVHYYPMRMQDFTVLSESYNMVVAMNSLQYVGKDLPAVVPCLVSGLKKGGKLIVRVPLKMRSKVENHDAKLTAKKLLGLFSELHCVWHEEYWTEDDPHPGADFPHEHYLVDLIFVKP